MFNMRENYTAILIETLKFSNNGNNIAFDK